MRRLTWLPCVLILFSACELYFGPEPPTVPEEPVVEQPGTPTTNTGCSDEFCAPPACVQDDECPSNAFCEELTGRCLRADPCVTSEDCAEGLACSDRFLCVPSPCRTHADCMEGCYCDIGAGYCIEGGFCQTSDDCLAGFTCETGRETCEPEPHDPDEEDCDED